MERVRQYFLFQTRPSPQLSRGRRAAFWGWNLGVLLLASAGLALTSALLATGPYPLNVALGYFERPLIFLLNLLPCTLLIFLLYAVTGRAGCAFLISGAVVLGFSLGNYYKLSFRDDPLMFADLLLLKEAGNMAGKYTLFVSRKIIFSLVCVVAGWAFLHFFVRGRLKVRGRILTGLISLLCAALLVPVYLSETIYSVRTAYYERIESRWSATQQYLAHGFLYPFLHSADAAFPSPPPGYSRQAADELLSGFQERDIPREEQVNVVGIMLEAYNDFTKFGTPRLAQDVYKVWHDLEDEGYSGNLVTNIFAGGTVDTERCFLTGSAALEDFRGNTNSYAWYFREQGYTVEGMHPCNQWFYNRLNVNESLGFERYLYVENYFGQFTGGQVALDAIFFPELLKAYQAGTAGEKPYFNFSVSYQGHGPYNSDKCWWGEKGDFVMDDGSYTSEQQYILDNYFGSIADTNQHLKEFTDYLRADDEPVVLVLFGDHNPWMGDGNSVYTAMGINFDLGTQQGFLDYYSTRYIIWANDAAKEALGCDFQGEGPDISPCFLMNELFRLCGWDGPAYLQAVDEVSRQVPVVHVTDRYMEDGVLTDTLTEDNEALVRDYKILSYDWRHRFRYEETAQPPSG